MDKKLYIWINHTIKSATVKKKTKFKLKNSIKEKAFLFKSMDNNPVNSEKAVIIFKDEEIDSNPNESEEQLDTRDPDEMIYPAKEMFIKSIRIVDEKFF